MHLFDVVDERELQRCLNDGLVSKRNHPTMPLSILNYTVHCGTV